MTFGYIDKLIARFYVNKLSQRTLTADVSLFFRVSLRRVDTPSKSMVLAWFFCWKKTNKNWVFDMLLFVCEKRIAFQHFPFNFQL